MGLPVAARIAEKAGIAMRGVREMRWGSGKAPSGYSEDSDSPYKLWNVCFLSSCGKSKSGILMFESAGSLICQDAGYEAIFRHARD